MRGLLDFAVIDPGSVNLTQVATKATARAADTYLNPEAHIRHALDFAARHGLHPAFAIYEPGFTRAGAALLTSPTPLRYTRRVEPDDPPRSSNKKWHGESQNRLARPRGECPLSP